MQRNLFFTRLYDKDKDGYITKSEMEKLSKNLSKEQIDKVKKNIIILQYDCSSRPIALKVEKAN